MKKFKYFDGATDALAYMAAELIATLEEDLRKQNQEERQHYTNEDRRDMKNKIADMRAIENLVLYAENMRRELVKIYRLAQSSSIGDIELLLKGTE